MTVTLSLETVLTGVGILAGVLGPLGLLIWRVGVTWSRILGNVESMNDAVTSMRNTMASLHEDIRSEARQRASDIADIRSDVVAVRDQVVSASSASEQRARGISDRLRRVESAQGPGHA